MNDLDRLITALEANTRAVKELIELDHTILQVLVEELTDDEQTVDPLMTLNG